LSLEEISDRLEIRQLLVAYSTAIDQRRFDDLDRVFTSDGYIGEPAHPRRGQGHGVRAAVTPKCVSMESVSRGQPVLPIAGIHHIDGVGGSQRWNCFALGESGTRFGSQLITWSKST